MDYRFCTLARPTYVQKYCWAIFSNVTTGIMLLQECTYILFTNLVGLHEFKNSDYLKSSTQTHISNFQNENISLYFTKVKFHSKVHSKSLLFYSHFYFICLKIKITAIFPIKTKSYRCHRKGNISI